MLALGSEAAPQEDEGYGHLHFLLAGLHGEQSYRDGCGSDLTITWKDGEAAVGTAACPVTWRILAEGSPVQ